MNHGEPKRVRLRAMPKIAIRSATSQDAPVVSSILLDATRTAMPYLPELYSDEEVLEWVTSSVLLNDDVRIADLDGQPAGFLALSEELLDHLYVHPDAQHRGVGSTLLDHAKRLRPRGFSLWVFQRNTIARRFYEARGVRLVRLSDGSGNEEREPDALYSWSPAGNENVSDRPRSA
jgi:ribosomal protein S18 acetylase RimI-like enzyme